MTSYFKHQNENLKTTRDKCINIRQTIIKLKQATSGRNGCSLRQTAPRFSTNDFHQCCQCYHITHIYELNLHVSCQGKKNSVLSTTSCQNVMKQNQKPKCLYNEAFVTILNNLQIEVRPFFFFYSEVNIFVLELLESVWFFNYCKANTFPFLLFYHNPPSSNIH